ncbi:cytochrome P450 [Pleurotus eryngii]|uniref:Cytochrome P450 n=1 Tax=Pleurotus eryngii TaxID=5323 RepID=A0A9P5ZYQ3_PLEER|nr:cytochrome P450 [Pleurotus eryngii]
MDSVLLQASLLVSLAGVAFYVLNKRIGKVLPLPPGPPADPVIGHLRVFPKANPELVFHDWAKIYVPHSYQQVIRRCHSLSFFGRSLVVLNSLQAAVELLEKRSAIYSDRPDFIVYDLMGWTPNLPFLPYGERFKKHRAIFHSHFIPEACVDYRHIQLQNVHLLVEGLMKNQGYHDRLLSRFTSSIAIRIAYGHQVRSDDDEYISIANDCGVALRQGGAGGTLVDLFPSLQYFPSWFPGTYFANVGRGRKWAINRLYDYPYESVKKEMAEGIAEHSFLAAELEAAAGRELNKEEVDDIKGVAGGIFAGGTETTWSSLTVFFLAMLLYPECQKRGQEEVDRVIGEHRLPLFDDIESLPYVNCVVQEIFRWKPVIPLGIPHRCTEDDNYRGMLIPKGSLVFANARAMALDPSTYKDPSIFDPARFLPEADGERGEPLFEPAFGFGRRICPGRHLANASVFIADENGLEITPSLAFETGLTSHPEPFPCNVVCRSESTARLIQEAVDTID